MYWTAADPGNKMREIYTTVTTSFDAIPAESETNYSVNLQYCSLENAVSRFVSTSGLC